jgi:hypothetical protein
MPGAGNPRTVGDWKLWAFGLQQLDYSGNVFLFGLSEAIPPFLKFVCILHLPFHSRNITDMAYFARKISSPSGRSVLILDDFPVSRFQVLLDHLRKRYPVMLCNGPQQMVGLWWLDRPASGC